MSNEVLNPTDFLQKITPQSVHSTLKKSMLADGFDIVLDLEKSKGSKIYDSKTGDEYLDLFTFFASNPLGMNHPKLDNEEFKKILGKVAVNNPSNSDIYTVEMAEFVNTFATLAKPDFMKYLFFIAGGALAIENGLKVAFDWKVRKNIAKGHKEEKGHQVIHFKEAFHGRSGYTMSLTNTDPNKVQYFPKFNWPRISNPKIIFPIDKNLDQIIKKEGEALNQIYAAIKNNPDDIAVIILEPIQAEGGDNFFRKEFLLKLKEISLDNDILLMFDEVQTGFGLTGKFWASEHYLQPDIIAFGKKAQVCGIMVSERVDEVENNVFKKSSRINSTWGGNLVDMVRSRRILEVIYEDKLVENAKIQGEYLLNKLLELQNEFPDKISNSRGLGLMCAFDFENAEKRDKFKNEVYKEKLIILGCGEKSIRFRPALTVTKNNLDEGLNIIRKVLNSHL